MEPNTQGVAKDFITTELSLESLIHISYLVYYAMLHGHGHGHGHGDTAIFEKLRHDTAGTRRLNN